MADFVGADFGGSAMFRQRDFMAENLIKNRVPSAEPK
jgi:hypothetical protein